MVKLTILTFTHSVFVGFLLWFISRGAKRIMGRDGKMLSCIVNINSFWVFDNQYFLWVFVIAFSIFSKRRINLMFYGITGQIDSNDWYSFHSCIVSLFSKSSFQRCRESFGTRHLRYFLHLSMNHIGLLYQLFEFSNGYWNPAFQSFLFHWKI